MALNIRKICSILPKRYYAASVNPQAASCNKKEVEVTTLANKMVVASCDSPTPGLCKVAIAVRAGSRFEIPDNLGVSHILRSSAGLSTCSASHFAISKNIQQLGATLSATSDRETIVYILETTSNNLDCGLQYLKYAVVSPQFRPWEISDNIPRIKYEIAVVPPQVKVVDLIHKAAYRNGLGYSIFAKKYNISKINSETLQHYYARNFLTSKTSIAGVGVGQKTLVAFGEGLEFDSGQGEAVKAEYHSGEIRKEKNYPLAHVIIAGESCALSSKEVFAYAVLRNALGSGCSIKRGAGSDPLSKAVSSCANGPVSAQALSMSHSDSGLFGVLISCTPDDAHNAVTGAMKAMESGVTEDDVCRGKAQLRAQLLYCAESSDLLLNDIVNQCALLGGAKSPLQLLPHIDDVTSSDVQKALKKIVSGNKSMASIGNIHSVPYLDEF